MRKLWNGRDLVIISSIPLLGSTKPRSCPRWDWISQCSTLLLTIFFFFWMLPPLLWAILWLFQITGSMWKHDIISYFMAECQQLIVLSLATLLAFLNGVLEGKKIMCSPVFQWWTPKCENTFSAPGFFDPSSNWCAQAIIYSTRSGHHLLLIATLLMIKYWARMLQNLP